MKKRSIVSLLLVLMMVMTSFTSAFGINGTLQHRETGALISPLDYLFNFELFNEVANDLSTYNIRVNDKFFSAEEVDSNMQQDPSLSIEDVVQELDEAEEVEEVEEVVGDLEVEVVSAINTTTIELEFSDEIDPAKVLRANFRILDKAGDTERPASLVVSSDKTEVTLTVGSNHSPLNADDAPYQVRILSAFNESLAGDYDVEMPSAYPAIEEVSVTAGDTFEITFERDLVDTTPTPGDWSVEDLTDEDNTANVSGIVISDDTITVTVDEVDFFKDGRSYEVTIEEENIEDVFGNKNAAEIKHTFSTEAPADAPNAVSVEYVANDDVTQVHAIVTFDQPVKIKDGVGADSRIVDLEALVSVNLFGVDAYDSTEGNLDTTLGIDEFELNNDQIVLQNLGGDFRDDREFQLILEDDVVEQRGVLEAKGNEDTTRVTALGVDVDGATITGIELVSEEEVRITFNKAVTYDSDVSVYVAGFNDAGVYGQALTSDGVEAKVEMIEGGTVAVLTPDDSDEMFATGFVALNTENAVWVNNDAFVTISNEKKLGGINGIEFNDGDLDDNAAPVMVNSAVVGNQITITMSEGISAVNSGDEKNVTVAGDNGYEWAATIDNYKWTVASNNQIQIREENGDVFLSTVSAVVPAAAVQDAEENANAAFSTNVTPTAYALTLDEDVAGAAATLTGAGIYVEGQVADINVTANTGYVVQDPVWTGTLNDGTLGNASNADTTFTMGNADTTITANFNVGGISAADVTQTDHNSDAHTTITIDTVALDEDSIIVLVFDNEDVLDAETWSDWVAADFSVTGDVDVVGYNTDTKTLTLRATSTIAATHTFTVVLNHQQTPNTWISGAVERSEVTVQRLDTNESDTFDIETTD